MIDRFFDAVERAFAYLVIPVCVAVFALNFLPPPVRRAVYHWLLSPVM